MNNSIPIFPLNIVVFPYSKIPLHIFEERYKKMIDKCLKEKTGFGIISIIKQKLSDIGSYVEITDVLHKYENGESDIVVKGKQRFKLIKSTQHPDGYLIGEVEDYFDISAEFDERILEELRNNFVSILSKIKFKLEDAYWKGYQNHKLKSFKIAEKSGLTLEQQQEFLGIQKENDRIEFLLKHLENLENKLKENIMTGAIIMGDGYIN
ncbi:MAG TPA: LON peptidase substrate-binding domain-containing protein [Ignavibacteriaceae bacterium]|nr:LON peptidase substrate-binding domain-containing protein [Ignavibacteriaceae bacterium]